MSLELLGILCSPNKEADRLEDYLGVEFIEKPGVVLMTPRNRVTLAINSILPPFRNIGLLRLAFEAKLNVHGTYNPGTNIMFIHSDFPHTKLHENMHALINQFNPDFVQSGIKANDHVLTARMKFQPHPQDDAQRMWLVKIFDEGLAETGALHILFDRKSVTADVITPYDLATASGLDGDDLYRISFLNAVIARRDFVERIIDKFRQRSRVYEPVDWDDGETYLQMTYAGVYFCQAALNALMRQGLTAGEAITRLIKNPPTTLEQLKNPIKYTQIN